MRVDLVRHVGVCGSVAVLGIISVAVMWVGVARASEGGMVCIM